MCVYVDWHWTKPIEKNLAYIKQMKLQNRTKGNQDIQLRVGCRDLHFLTYIKIILHITSFFFPLKKKHLFFKVSPTVPTETSLEVCYPNCLLPSFCYRLTDNRGNVFWPSLTPAPCRRHLGPHGSLCLTNGTNWVMRLNKAGRFLPGCRQNEK